MANPNTQTIVKDSTPPPPVKRVLTVHERKTLGDAVAAYGYGDVQGQNFIPGVLGASATEVPWMRVNRPRLNEQQKTVAKILKEGTPEPTNEAERDKINKRVGELTEQILPFLQSRKEIRSYSHRDPDFITALEKADAWDKPQKELGGRTPQEVYEDRVNLCRRLEPENPNAGNIEKFRPK